MRPARIGDGHARWLWIEDHVPHPHATAYDAEAAGERARAVGWPDMESIQASLIAPLAPLEITQTFEQIRLATTTS